MTDAKRLTKAKLLTKANLRQFTGTEHWLLDEIAFAQRADKRVAAEAFQVWKLSVNADRTATLTCEDGDGNVVFSKPIAYTDFPIEDIVLCFIS